MNQGNSWNPIFVSVLVPVAVSIVLLVIGLILHRRRLLTSRLALLGWAILTIAPLFGAGLFLFTKHQVERGEKTQPGQDNPPPGGADHI